MSTETVVKVEQWNDEWANRWAISHLAKEERQDAMDITHDAWVIWKLALKRHEGQPLYMPIISALHYARRRYRQERYRHTRKYPDSKEYTQRYAYTNEAYHSRRMEIKDNMEYYTHREGSILRLISEGYTMGEVANILHVSPSRVTQLVKRIQTKAQIHGLVHVPPQLPPCPARDAIAPGPTRAGIGNWVTSVLGGTPTMPKGVTSHVPRKTAIDEQLALQKLMCHIRYGICKLPDSTHPTTYVKVGERELEYIGQQ